jgi:hypothetical protein
MRKYLLWFFRFWPGILLLAEAVFSLDFFRLFLKPNTYYILKIRFEKVFVRARQPPPSPLPLPPIIIIVVIFGAGCLCQSCKQAAD